MALENPGAVAMTAAASMLECLFKSGCAEAAGLVDGTANGLRAPYHTWLNVRAHVETIPAGGQTERIIEGVGSRSVSRHPKTLRP